MFPVTNNTLNLLTLIILIITHEYLWNVCTAFNNSLVFIDDAKAFYLNIKNCSKL